VILPGRERLLVEREKIVDYLLNPDHRYGASKARFFGAFGFRREDWEVLRDALCEHGRRWEVAIMTETGFGPRYARRIGDTGWSSPTYLHRWQLDADQTAPRLITAYPSEAS
jgi:hypothetical protein